MIISWRYQIMQTVFGVFGGDNYTDRMNITTHGNY